MLPLGPGALGVSDELGHEVGRADDIVVAEGGPDILQEFHADGASCSSPESRQAARRPSSGQVPPARSAIARSGRQLSAARSFRSGIFGSGSASLSKLSAAQRAA